MNKMLCALVSLVLAFFLFLLPVHAKENEWVYDEAEVISTETKDYVRTLNEDVFATYRRKPQLGIIIINRIPDGYSMEKYKLEQFNQLGVGTTDENCGMLFVFAVEDRKYGFEIGDGFKEGSLLRKDLETDFVSEDMKELLRNEKYDDVVLQVVKYLEQIMADEEAGVYEKRESEYAISLQNKYAKAQERKMEMLNKVPFLASVIIVGFAFYCLGSRISRLLRKNKIRKFLKSNIKYVTFFNWDVPVVVEYLLREMSVLSIMDFDSLFWKCLYEYFVTKEYEKLKSRSLKNPVNYYTQHLRCVNNPVAFRDLNVKDIDTIIREVDSKMERDAEIEKINYKMIRDYIEDNMSRMAIKNIPLSELEEGMKKHCVCGKEMDKDVLREAFEVELKELNFRHAYDEFLEENKGKFDTQYFDYDKFYDSLKMSSEYENHKGYDFTNYYWMLPLLYHHVHNNKEQEESERVRKEQEVQNSYTIFGSDFGGGNSSGGGFSGGW